MNDKSSSANTEQIWRELSDRLRQFIRSRVNSAADVDDILQTVFLRIHQNFDSLRRAQRIESWVFQVTRNVVTDHFRKKRQATNEDSSFVAVAEQSADENVNSEAAGCITALINRLPEDQRRAVSLYELQGLSQAEIAQRESISLSGAKSRVQRGRKKLVKLLLACCQFQLDARGNVLEYEPVSNECITDCGQGRAGR